MPPSLPSADAYMNEPVRYPPLTIVDIAAEAAAVSDEYRNQVLSQVNTSCMRLAVFTGEYRWHHHPQADELFLVVEGCLEIDLADERTLTLAPWQSVVVPAGTIPPDPRHRPHREPLLRGLGRSYSVRRSEQPG